MSKGSFAYHSRDIPAQFFLKSHLRIRHKKARRHPGLLFMGSKINVQALRFTPKAEVSPTAAFVCN